MSNDELPRFPATRILLDDYGDDWATWGFILCGVATLAALAIASADAASAPADVVLPSIVSFGLCTLVAGFFWGVVWSGLYEDAQERWQDNG